MPEISTITLARQSDAVEIAEMSRELIEAGLTWAWTPARVQHFISGTDSSVVVARRSDARNHPSRRLEDRRGDRRRADGRHYDTLRQDLGRDHDHGVAAFAIMHFGDDTAHLNLLAVAPEYRRQGLGRQLLDWLTATAIEAGVFRINLELRSHNEDARAFYERLGYVALGTVQGYYQGREAALRMSRRLTLTPAE